MSPLSREERAECEAALGNLIRQGLVFRAPDGRLRSTPRGDHFCRAAGVQTGAVR